MNRLVGLMLVGSALALSGSGTGCAGLEENEETGADEAAVTTVAGVNGGACYHSGYNCKLRVKGGNRIAHVDGELDWGVDPGETVLDGNGDPLIVEKASSLKFNYGQRRTFGGKPYVFAMTTENKSSGWYPLSAVKSADVLSGRVGDATAHRSGLKKMACYAVKNSTDPTLEEKKVVYDTTSAAGPAGEAAGDYLPRLRANMKRSMNLIYNMPGAGLGGPAIDHFPEGTKFQRLDVPTSSGAPSFDVDLWEQDSKKHFKKAAGTMKFIYGYVVTKTGEVRAGWMALDGLEVSSGCK